MNTELKEKYDSLIEILKGYGKVAVAFSGGVDSTFLLYAASQALGDGAAALTSRSGFVPAREFTEADEYCASLKVKHIVLDTDVLSIPGVADNPKDRCYICKRALFQGFIDAAEKEGISVVAEGSNVDDEGDYRPGLRAIAELGIKSPLREAGLTKQEIRDLSKEAGLPTWSKPSFACLASRIPYGERITPRKLSMVEQAEQFLLDKGFKQFRVRAHESGSAAVQTKVIANESVNASVQTKVRAHESGNSSMKSGDKIYKSDNSSEQAQDYEATRDSSICLARIELLPEDMGRMLSPDLRNEINQKLRTIGFSYVSLDLQGYRTGSLNEVL